jgi:DNA-binding MarR family transcriptional regulator
MTETICISDRKWHQRSAELDPLSRVALIMEHAERLAEQASSTRRPNRSSGTLVRRIIAARADRRKFFADDLFADPAWDILLELYALKCEHRRTSVSKLCIAAGIPTTTALRWLEKLHKEGLIEREPDPLDARRVWVAISDQGAEAMERYLSEVAESRLSL